MNPASNLCEQFEAEGVWLWLDNDMSNVERKRWESHLETCEACQHILAETKSTLERYDAIEGGHSQHRVDRGHLGGGREATCSRFLATDTDSSGSDHTCCSERASWLGGSHR